jgi:hypothetical protein
MREQRFQTFDEFWPFYVREHSKKATRALHFAGTTTAMACLAGGVLLRKRSLLALAPIAGYGAAWIGHFFVEKNRPASFGDPLWSLWADLLMWSKMITGTMDAEVERVMSSNGHHHEPESGDAAREEISPEAGVLRERQSLN